MADASSPLPQPQQEPEQLVEQPADPQPEPTLQQPFATETARAMEVVHLGGPTAEAEPASEPTPEPAPEPVAVPEVPTVVSTMEVPALERPSGGDAEGGEWDLLLDKLRQWIASGQLQQIWQTSRTPLTAAAGLIGLLLVLRIYGALLGVLDSLPLLPGLLELAGLVAVVRFSLSNLVRSSDRGKVIANVKGRWAAFRGNR
ncbi:CAAD domain-containing protein [Synechococcus sp. HJ21-Hayes]|jgi:hypothetical protein|uniref:CAAD domain-containing protein n=1 Tax=unclassified Synechococcus TaxID=2626047 RepID=UPI0020CC07B3|nr:MULTISPECIES: CAAD domain-containing protein [unclassified Synechococcus]MCP9832316.1 CAAD domain-containing protein [Synechococcus sp. JJ3a-Johnson]MCP9853567.1 CAAD domain-containing protein [Synechococcus sp. HJ21-Hayes]